MLLLYIGNSFKTFKLVIIIFVFSYFIGMFYYIWCDLTNNLQSVQDRGTDTAVPQGSGENFIDYYQLESQYNPWERTLVITYFSFTSLSTVGFGDYNPRSDYERIVISGMLMFGVAIFSYVMGNFIEIIDKIQCINEDFCDGNNLSKFFGMIKFFNKGFPLKI